MSCDRCGRTIYPAEDAQGRVIRVVEILFEPVFVAVGDRLVPFVGSVYVDHEARCPSLPAGGGL